MPLADVSQGPRTSDAPVPGQDECEGMFEHFLQTHKEDPKNKLTEEEQRKFRSSFADPKFREMLADYMEEISDPKYRAETEQYISQMEADDQVPAGKELVRPEACFVVKSHIVPMEKKDDLSEKGEKLFVNIVQSPQIAPPVGQRVEGGMQWSLPLSLGPKRFEADKGEALVPAFDACFHPEALKMVRENKSFRDYVVNTALDQVQAALNPLVRGVAKDFVRRDYHVLRGVSYKNGTPAIMMMQSDKMTDAKKKAQQPLVPPSTSSSDSKELQKSSGNKKKNKKASKAVKKGFLNSSTSTPTSTSTPPNTAATPSLVTEMANRVTSPTPASTATPSAPTSTRAGTPTPRATAVITSKLQDSSESSSGDITPSYHMKERGSYRVSDSMMTRVVQPSRPTELEVVIELPALANKSNMDLDVSTEKLKFSALRSSAGSSYKLDLKLPYPCHGEKGKARFDKVRKELKVTIPVVAPKYVEQEEVIGQKLDKLPTKKSVETISSSVNEKEQVLSEKDDDDEEVVSEKVRKAEARKKVISRQEEKSKQAQPDHSKFLSKNETKRMTFDLPEGATLIAPTPTPKPVTSPDTPASTTTMTSTAPSNPPLPPPHFPVNGSFTPSTKFAGPSPGYVFKLGDQGLGYYLDGEIEEEEEEVEEEVEVEDVIAPYEFKQMKDVITILVQVPQIESTSVSSRYQDNHLYLSFQQKNVPNQTNNLNEDMSENREKQAELKRYTLILKTFGVLDSDKCRFDVADKNMIVVLFKASSGIWENPFLSVESDDYELVFGNDNKLKHKIKFIRKVKQPIIKSSSSKLSDNLKNDLAEKEYYEKLEASKDSIEKAAAQQSIQCSTQGQRLTSAAMSSHLTTVVGAQNASNSRNSGNDVVAPTSFQNTIMFELD